MSSDIDNFPQDILKDSRAFLRQEAAAIAGLAMMLDDSFSEALAAILNCAGHIITSGAGTSSAVARRLAHLLSCVGSPAFFLDPGMSLHGSAGAVKSGDILIAISKGGETDELNNLIEVAGIRGATVISITSREGSTMEGLSDIVVRFTTEDAVDGFGMITLGNSLAAAAVGDAMCFALLTIRGFDREEFLKLHPGGAVGKMLKEDV